MAGSLSDRVKRVDEDRWLAAQFAPAEARRRLIALYALNYEIAHIPEIVHEPAAGDIRLAWWSAALSELGREGANRTHPTLKEFDKAFLEPPIEQMLAIIDARARDLDLEPFNNWNDLENYVEATAVNLMRAAARACVEEDVAQAADPFLLAAGRAWGFTGLVRADGYQRARGRNITPRAHRGDLAEPLIERAEAAYAVARDQAAKIAKTLFPAFGYVAIVPLYIESARNGDAEASLFTRHWRLITASASGKV